MPFAKFASSKVAERHQFIEFGGGVVGAGTGGGEPEEKVGRKVWRGLIFSIVRVGTNQAMDRTVSLNPSAFAALATVEKERFPLLDKA